MDAAKIQKLRKIHELVTSFLDQAESEWAQPKTAPQTAPQTAPKTAAKTAPKTAPKAHLEPIEGKGPTPYEGASVRLNPKITQMRMRELKHLIVTEFSNNNKNAEWLNKKKTYKIVDIDDEYDSDDNIQIRDPDDEDNEAFVRPSDLWVLKRK